MARCDIVTLIVSCCRFTFEFVQRCRLLRPIFRRSPFIPSHVYTTLMIMTGHSSLLLPPRGIIYLHCTRLLNQSQLAVVSHLSVLSLFLPCFSTILSNLYSNGWKAIHQKGDLFLPTIILIFLPLAVLPL